MNEKLFTQAYDMHFIEHFSKEKGKKKEKETKKPHQTLTEHTQSLWDQCIFVPDICQNTSIPSKTHSLWSQHT